MSSEVRARPWPASERGFAWRAGRPLWKLLAAPVPASFVPTPDPLGAWHNPPASPRLSFASSCGCPLLACEPMPPEPAFCDGFPPPSPPAVPPLPSRRPALTYILAGTAVRVHPRGCQHVKWCLARRLRCGLDGRPLRLAALPAQQRLPHSRGLGLQGLGGRRGLGGREGGGGRRGKASPRGVRGGGGGGDGQGQGWQFGRHGVGRGRGRALWWEGSQGDLCGQSEVA